VFVIDFISWFLSTSWRFFTEITVPGFDFSFAALFVGFFLANLGLRFLFMMLGIGFGRDDVSVIGRLKPRTEVKGFR
jgi:hypothetical protein